MATANVQISNWTSVEKKSFPSLERILWIWNTVSQGKTNLSGIGSLKPSFVASQSPFLCLFYVFFFFPPELLCVKKTLRKSKGNNSCNLHVSRSFRAKSKILSNLFHLVSGSESPASHSHLLAKGCAENESSGPIFLSEVQICRLLPCSAVIQLSKPQRVFRNHKISPNNRLFASSQIPRLRKAFFSPCTSLSYASREICFQRQIKTLQRSQA